MKDAADAIEELQDKVFELEEQLNDADIAADDNGRQVEDLQAEVNRLELDNEDYEHEHRRLRGEIEALQAAEPTESQVVDYCHKRCLAVVEADLFNELKASYGKMPKRGEWITDGKYSRHCSICNESVAWPEKYCPNCGAKMDGEVEHGEKNDG